MADEDNNEKPVPNRYPSYQEWMEAYLDWLNGLRGDEFQAADEKRTEDFAAAEMWFGEGRTTKAASKIAFYENQQHPEFIGYETVGIEEQGGPEYHRAIYDPKNPMAEGLQEQVEAYDYIPGARKVTKEDAADNLIRLTNNQRVAMAYDMFVNVTGAYGSFNDIFDDDNNLNMETFMDAWEVTFNRALQSVTSAGVLTREYFDILMRPETRGVSDSELQMMMDSALEDAPDPGTDPADLKLLYRDQLGRLLGRRPTTTDQRKMLRFMSEQQKARPTASPVGLMTEFIQGDMPDQYAASESGRFEQGVMAVIRNATSGRM